MRLAGPVYRVLGRPHPGHDRHLDPAGCGDAGVRAVRARRRLPHERPHLGAPGELSVTSLATRGCAGAVLDGGVRDAEYILREDFPIVARS
jgi:regulator of RNase E activity RraA